MSSNAFIRTLPFSFDQQMFANFCKMILMLSYYKLQSVKFDWLKHGRCKVQYFLLLQRVKAYGNIDQSTLNCRSSVLSLSLIFFDLSLTNYRIEQTGCDLSVVRHLQNIIDSASHFLFITVINKCQISYLQHCMHVPMLFLTDNEITAIQGLSSCHRLEYLSLRNNKIDHIQGLDCLPLKYLNLVNNCSLYSDCYSCMSFRTHYIGKLILIPEVVVKLMLF